MKKDLTRTFLCFTQARTSSTAFLCIWHYGGRWLLRCIREHSYTRSVWPSPYSRYPSPDFPRPHSRALVREFQVSFTPWLEDQISIRPGSFIPSERTVLKTYSCASTTRSFPSLLISSRVHLLHELFERDWDSTLFISPQA